MPTTVVPALAKSVATRAPAAMAEAELGECCKKALQNAKKFNLLVPKHLQTVGQSVDAITVKSAAEVAQQQALPANDPSSAVTNLARSDAPTPDQPMRARVAALPAVPQASDGAPLTPIPSVIPRVKQPLENSSLPRRDVSVVSTETARPVQPQTPVVATVIDRSPPPEVKAITLPAVRVDPPSDPIPIVTTSVNISPVRQQPLSKLDFPGSVEVASIRASEAFAPLQAFQRIVTNVVTGIREKISSLQKTPEVVPSTEPSARLPFRQEWKQTQPVQHVASALPQDVKVEPLKGVPAAIAKPSPSPASDRVYPPALERRSFLTSVQVRPPRIVTARDSVTAHAPAPEAPIPHKVRREAKVSPRNSPTSAPVLKRSTASQQPAQRPIRRPLVNRVAAEPRPRVQVRPPPITQRRASTIAAIRSLAIRSVPVAVRTRVLRYVRARAVQTLVRRARLRQLHAALVRNKRTVRRMISSKQQTSRAKTLCTSLRAHLTRLRVRVPAQPRRSVRKVVERVPKLTARKSKETNPLKRRPQRHQVRVLQSRRRTPTRGKRGKVVVFRREPTLLRRTLRSPRLLWRKKVRLTPDPLLPGPLEIKKKRDRRRSSKERERRLSALAKREVPVERAPRGRSMPRAQEQASPKPTPYISNDEAGPVWHLSTKLAKHPDGDSDDPEQWFTDRR